MSPLTDQRRSALKSFRDTYALEGISLELLDVALTHRSWSFETAGDICDNERLEFLGDSVLGCIAADYLYETYPDLTEGDLSKMKAFLVSRSQLGLRAAEIGIAPILLLGHGEDASGGRKRSSTLGSALEAVIGAVYISLDFCALSAFVREYVLIPGREALENDQHLDFKSRLQEIVQQQAGVLPEYRKVGQEGPPHARRFTVEVYLGDKLLGKGSGKRIKSAENAAARQACEHFENET